MSHFTQSHIEDLVRQGKIKSYKIHPKRNEPLAPHLKPAAPPRHSPEKQWIEDNLQWWCNQHAVSLEMELQFSADRKFRFDWAIPAIRVAVEYEGIYSVKSRHTTQNGFNRDMEKYNLAQLEGWIVLRYSAKTYKHLINDLKKVKL